MTKPSTFDGYTDQHTVDCERVLVTLLRGLGPWKESVFLVGGLTPRYLVAARPPAVPPHAGTLDVDIVIDLQILADTEGTVKLTGASDSSPENALSSGLLIRYKSPVASRKTLGLERVDSGSLRDDVGQLGTSSEPHHGQRETVGCVSLI